VYVTNTDVALNHTPENSPLAEAFGLKTLQYRWHNANSVPYGLKSNGVDTMPSSSWTPVM
jgi:hypothetical protein